jgi:BirA family biotin operon repressor/biotin-[acetyl-CoA-carboxylase] ligase
VWEGLWGVREVEAWSSLPSTNDRARERALEGAASWTVVLAEEQTRGRGRSGRDWFSPRGMGLWLSFLIDRQPSGEGLLSPLLAGLALARGLESVTGVEAGVKWPNDVWVSGRKVAGVLCESAGRMLVVGAGVNVRQRDRDFPPELRGRAGSLETASGRAVSRSALATALLTEARRLLDRPVLRLDEALQRELASRDVLRGRPVRVAGTAGQGAGFDALGRLQVETRPGVVESVVAGHVELEGVGA